MPTIGWSTAKYGTCIEMSKLRLNSIVNNSLFEIKIILAYNFLAKFESASEITMLSCNIWISGIAYM